MTVWCFTSLLLESESSCGDRRGSMSLDPHRNKHPSLNKRKRYYLTMSWPLPPTGSQPAAGEERRCQSQHPSHGNRQDSLCAQQLPALSSAEGRFSNMWRVRRTPAVSFTVRWQTWCDLYVSRLKSFSRMSWRGKSLERQESRHCSHLRSTPLPKSEYSKTELELFVMDDSNFCDT